MCNVLFYSQLTTQHAGWTVSIKLLCISVDEGNTYL